jgi:hypothetical protein
MEHEQALAILKALAEGVDPVTGARFAADTPWQHADTVRALHRAVAALEASATAAPPAAPAEARRPATGRGNAGKPWSKEEDEKLVAGFDAGQTVEALAVAHSRSRFAIEARLARFGKMPMPTGLRIAGSPRAAEPAAAYAARRIVPHAAGGRA